MKQKMSNKGYTLIEIMVTMIIFSLVFGMISGLFVLALKAQRRSLVSRELLAQTSHVMEYMTRQIRMAQKATVANPCCIGGSCVGAGNNYVITDRKGLLFLNYNSECWEFFLEENRLKREINGGFPIIDFLTSETAEGLLEVEEFKINLIGETGGDDIQPRVTFFLKIRGKGEKAEEQPIIKIQNTVSQRNLDVE